MQLLTRALLLALVCMAAQVRAIDFSDSSLTGSTSTTGVVKPANVPSGSFAKDHSGSFTGKKGKRGSGTGTTAVGEAFSSSESHAHKHAAGSFASGSHAAAASSTTSGSTTTGFSVNAVSFQSGDETDSSSSSSSAIAVPAIAGACALAVLAVMAVLYKKRRSAKNNRSDIFTIDKDSAL